ncbi:hypothetical protein BH10PSE4_BH10PSE4_26440 [soil metagenome]
MSASWKSAAKIAPLRLGADIKVQLRQVGGERQPLLVVDNVLQDPDAMIDAARAAEFYTPEHTHYPGLNAPLPEAYYRTVVTALRGPIEAAFGLPQAASLSYFGFFALATTGLADADPIQKIPHHDAPDPGRLAMVHYLCRGNFGGTGFFRHEATGFETVDARRNAAYVAAAQAELDAGEPVAFPSGEMAHYAMIGEAEKVFNRLIVYRGHALHAALLDPEPGSADPALGRLTANGFFAAAGAR